MKIRIESNVNSVFLSRALATSYSEFSVKDGGYGLIEANVYNEQSDLYKTDYEILVFAFSIEFLESLLIFRQPFACDIDAEYEKINQIITNIVTLIETFHSFKSQIPVCLFSFPNQVNTPFSYLETNSKNYSFNRIINDINSQLATKIASMHNAYLFDINNVILNYGYKTLFDRRMWYLAKSPYSELGIKYVTQELTAFIKRIQQPSKKVLVLDLDNTLWGGVVGEEGIDGILLSSDGAGKAYQDFQKEIINLKNRGVILALCSKNNEQDVIDIFDHHADMRLQWEDFIVKKINWDDKVKNINQIADQLNIGIDSMVFLDDNPTERLWVKSALPQVDVPEFPSDPSELAIFLRSLDAFKVINITPEDYKKTDSYKAELSRNSAKHTAISYESYLSSLKLRCIVRSIDDTDIKRVAQLLAKTNQFNFTTKRYTEAEIFAFHKDRLSNVLSLSVSDRFGDYGLVGLVILIKESKNAIIDSFILSCRVLGKKIEDYLLASALKYCVEQWDCSSIEGLYCPTEKNRQIDSFYEKRGFEYIGETNGTRRYTINDPVFNFPDHIKA